MDSPQPIPPPAGEEPPLPDETPGVVARVWQFFIGKPRDLRDKSIFHQLSLVPFLAWVGLGADGLSSSAYGPPEAYIALGDHTYLSIALALATAFTVLVISAAYSRIIEAFPHGGGGYVVASKLLGPNAGLISGCALLVDYVLTVTTSITAAGEAIFSFVPISWQPWRLWFDAFCVIGMTTLNIRGVKDSIIPLVPVFLMFLATHLLLILMGIGAHAPELPQTAMHVAHGFKAGYHTLGAVGMLMLFARAYSLGGGTYTGIEAVSNGLPIMREPRVHTGQRTMLYMATSLAFTAGGLHVCYLLVHIVPVEGKTLNAVLLEYVFGNSPVGQVGQVLGLFSEGLLLVVAAQAGFIDGPRVLANMATDAWAPRRFAVLSERLTAQNGIVLMGGASLAALFYTRGNVGSLVVMYSINVFVTFSLSMLAMFLHSLKLRSTGRWKRKTALFLGGFILCATILVVTSLEKFAEGGWITLSITLVLVVLFKTIKRHYTSVAQKLDQLTQEIVNLPLGSADRATREFDGKLPTAVILVGGYNGLGIHTVLNLFRAFGDHFKNLVFISAGTIDSGAFKGEEEMEALQKNVETQLEQYLTLARRIGVAARARSVIGTDPVDDLEGLCRELMREYSKVTFVAGQVIFRKERWFHGFLHNQTAYLLQKRLQWAGFTMVILPVRVR